MRIFHIVGVALLFLTIVEAQADQKSAKSSTSKSSTTTETKSENGTTEEQTTSSKSSTSEEVVVSSDDYGKPRGLLGDITVGPQITIFGLPSFFRFGAEAKYKNIFGFGLEYGFIPTMSSGTNSASLNMVQGSVKWFPSNKSFYLGLAVGSQNFTVTAPVTITGTVVTITGNANTFFLTPMLGWKWVAHSGLFLGMDVGWQFALSSSGTTTTNNAALNAAAIASGEFRSADDLLKNIGKTSLPSLTMLQIGYYF